MHVAQTGSGNIDWKLAMDHQSHGLRVVLFARLRHANEAKCKSHGPTLSADRLNYNASVPIRIDLDAQLAVLSRKVDYGVNRTAWLV